MTSEELLPPTVSTALAAIRREDADALRASLDQIDSEGWESVLEPTAAWFVEGLTRVLGPQPSVGDFVNYSQVVYPYTSRLLSVTPYDIEFACRGFTGAQVLMRQIPRNILGAVMLVCGAHAETVAGQVAVGAPAYDRL